MRTRTIWVLLIVVAFVSACSTTNSQTPTSNAPSPTTEIKVTAYQYGFEPSIVTLKKGEPVRLTFTSRDVMHGVSLPDFGKATKEFGPGTSESIDIVPAKTGTFTYQCSVYCGGGHPRMMGTIIVTD